MIQRKKLNTAVAEVLEGMGPSKRELMEHRRVALRQAISRMQADRTTPAQQLITQAQTWKIPRPPAGVVPKGAVMAMDDAIDSYSTWAMQNALFAEGQAFLGYPYLAELSQRPEYRVIAETWAQEMTRKWIRITSTGDSEIDDKTDKIKDIENAFTVFNVKQHMKKCIELDALFGRSQLFIDLGVDTDNRAELKSTLGASTSKLMKAKVRKGMLKGFKVIEPVWTYPNAYNAIDPLKEDFFKPTTWFVMGQEIHATRLLTFIGKPMPDLLKPAYAFGGLSMSQMAKPYVDNWLRTRQSVSDGISNFSIMILLTDMASMMNDGAALDIETRADFFNVARDNRGLMLADKNSEDLKNVSMPISGLDHLQAQAQEHMCSVSQIPLVKLTGISPSGLNASSEGEIRVFYDKVEASQESMLRGHLTTILNIVQLHLYGDIDPEISFEFEPLHSMDDTEASTVRKSEADTDIAYINAGVISPQEARVRLASDADSPYASLDTSEEALPQQQQPAPGEETDEQGNPLAGLLGAQAPKDGSAPAAGGESGQHPPSGQPPAHAGTVQQGNSASKFSQRPVTSQPVAAHDDWNEQLHPRGQPANKGEFAKSSGGGGSAQAKKSQQHGEQLEAPHTLPDDSPLLKDSREDKSEAAQKERRDIEENAFASAVPVTGRRPIIYVMGGGGAAGKGTLKAQLQAEGKIPSSGAVQVDPDAIKMSFKRYKDIAATGDSRASPTVHEDGSDLSRNILTRAAAGKYDVVYDATMSNFKKGLQKIQEFKNKGYDVHMFNVTMTDPEVAVQRAMDRFKKTGRWLDPDVLREAHKNFAAILKQYEHTADYFETYNSDNGFKLLESSKTTAPAIEGMPVDADGNVTLTHYSDVGGLQQLDPIAYGSGLKGSEAKRKEADPDNWVERTYHGVDVGNEGGYKKEAGLGTHVYQSKIPAHLMYDYQHDPDGLFQKAPEGHNPLSMYEKAIKDSGYQGYYVNHQSLGKVAATFYPMDATEVQNTAQDENPNHNPENGEFASGGGTQRKQLNSKQQPQSKVLFEVAPDPHDTALTQRWNKIDEHTRAVISSEVLDGILPEVQDKLGADEPLQVTKHVQYGGYLDNTNPSLSLLLGKSVTSAQAAMLTRVLGSALTQDSMMRVSEKPFTGSTEMGTVIVRVPADIGYKAVESMYNKLRQSVLDGDGKPLINGHTTDDGSMVILVDTGSEEAIHNQVLKVLGDKYEVGHGKLQVAWPEKGDDDYGFTGEDKTVRGKSESSVQQWVHSVRTRATEDLKHRIEQYEAGH